MKLTALLLAAGLLTSSAAAAPRPPKPKPPKGAITLTVLDVNGRKAGSVSVALRSQTGSPAVSSLKTTSKKGLVKWTKLPYTDYVIDAVKGNEEGSVTVSLTATRRTAKVTLQLEVPPPPVGTLMGHVRNPNGGLLIGASVGWGSTTLSTDSFGCYRAEQLSPGGYTVTASMSGYFSQTLPVTVSANTETPLDFVLSPVPTKGDIAGIVKNLQGQPLAGVTVALSNLSVTTGANGQFSFMELTPDSYAVTATRYDCYSDQESADVQAGTTTSVELVMVRKPVPVPSFTGAASPRFQEIGGLSLDAANNLLYMVEFGGNKVWALNATTLAPTTSWKPAVSQPFYVARRGDGTFFTCADGYAGWNNSSGQPLSIPSVYTNRQFQAPATRPDGEVVVVDGANLYVVSHTGFAATHLINEEGSSNAVAADEAYHFATTASGRLQVIDYDGNVVNTVTLGYRPIAIAVDTQTLGLFVADDAGTLRVYDKSAIVDGIVAPTTTLTLPEGGLVAVGLAFNWQSRTGYASVLNGINKVFSLRLD